jgi:hypothetical protein
VKEVRGRAELRAALTDRTPDYRPAGPVVRVPVTVSLANRLMAESADRK